MKKCGHCKEELSLDCFQKNRAAPDGLQYRCKICTKKASKECRAKRSHLWLQKTNPWRQRPENRERYNATVRARQAARPAEIKKLERRSWSLNGKYGISSELKEALISAQGGICSICFIPISIDCATDHDHKRDFVRGMLCKSCNSGLGFFKDNPAALRRAADYLDECETISQEATTEDFIEANRILEEVISKI